MTSFPHFLDLFFNKQNTGENRKLKIPIPNQIKEILKQEKCNLKILINGHSYQYMKPSENLNNNQQNPSNLFKDEVLEIIRKLVANPKKVKKIEAKAKNS